MKEISIERIREVHQAELKIADQLDAIFPDFQFRTYGNHRNGFYGCKAFSRRKWAIEVWQGANDEWCAGLYIENHVARHNYWWERALGQSAVEAAERLQLRINAMQQELAEVAKIVQEQAQ